MYNFGLIDLKEKKRVQEYVNQVVYNVTNGHFANAFYSDDEFLGGDLTPYATYFHNITGSNNVYNMMRTNVPDERWYFMDYV